MVAHPRAHHLKPLDDLGCGRNRAARAILSIGDLGSEVALDQRLHGALPVWVACAKDFVQHVKVDAVPFQVVFNAGQTKIDEGHMAVVHNQDVVRGEVAMGDRMSMKAANFRTNRLHDGKHVENRPVAEDFNQGAPVQALHDQDIPVDVRIEQGRDTQTRTVQPKKQSSLAQQALPSKALIEVGVSPRTGPSLLADGVETEPRPGGHLGFRAKVKHLSGLKHAHHAPWT